MIEGKIIKIIDDWHIIINVGLNNGVKENMNFAIYEVGDMIIDPDTNEELELLDMVRHNFRIIHVQDQIAVGFILKDEPIVLSFVEWTQLNHKTTPLSKEIKIGDLVKTYES